MQFSREAGAEPGVFSGRVEHLSSGRRTSFGSQDELLAVLLRLLADVVDEESAPPTDGSSDREE